MSYSEKLKCVPESAVAQYFSFVCVIILLLCVCCQDGSDGSFPVISDCLHKT